MVGLVKVEFTLFPKYPACGPFRLIFEVKKKRSISSTIMSFPTRPYVPRSLSLENVGFRLSKNGSSDTCQPNPTDGKKPQRNLGSNRSEPLSPKFNSAKYLLE